MHELKSPYNHDWFIQTSKSSLGKECGVLCSNKSFEHYPFLKSFLLVFCLLCLKCFHIHAMDRGQNRVAVSYKLTCECWEPNPGPVRAEHHSSPLSHLYCPGILPFYSYFLFYTYHREQQLKKYVVNTKWWVMNIRVSLILSYLSWALKIRSEMVSVIRLF